MRAIETRQKQIADGLAAGEAGPQGARQRREARSPTCWPRPRRKSAEIVATGEKFKAETIEQAKVEAKAEGERIIAAAKAEIEQEVARAKEQLRDAGRRPGGRRRGEDPEREVDAKAHAELLARAEAGAVGPPNAMAELTTIARPYAEAAFALARERQRAAGVVADAAPRQRASSPTRGWRRRSTTRSSTRGAKESLLLSICGDKLNAEGRNFVRVLIEADRARACCRRSRRCSRR